MTFTDPREERAPTAGRPLTGLAIAVAVGLVLRIWEAWESSLWLDELHTLSHAAQASLSAVAASVAAEYHTPLFFMAVHLLGAWEQGAWLRALPLLSSLVVLWPLASLVRSLNGGTRAMFLVFWLYACLPYQVHWATELRPYAWIALFSAAAVQLAFTDRGSVALRCVLFFLCVVLGLYTHRIMAVTVFSIGVARLVSRPAGALHLGWLVAMGALGVAPFLPWMVGFAGDMTTARFDYQEAVGGYQLRPQLVKEVLALPLRVFVPYVGALGGVWAVLSTIGSAALFGAIGWGALVRLREGPRITASAPVLRGLHVFLLTDFVVVTGLSIYTWDRVPLQYYAGLAWLLPVTATSFLLRRSFLAPIAVGAALLLGIAQAGGSCTEDMRGAVGVARQLGAELERQGEEPLYSALLSQPEVFDHGIPYRAYGRDLEVREPAELPHPGDADFERPVICLRRGEIPFGSAAWAPYTEGRRLLREVPVDAYLTVFVLVPEE